MEGVGLWDMHLSPQKNLREKRTDTQSLEAGSFTDTVKQWKEPCTWLYFVIGCSRHRANGPSQPKRPDQQLNCKPTQRSHCLREAWDSWTVRSQKMIGAFPPAARQKTDLGDRLYNQKTARVRCCRPAYEITQPLSSQRQLLSFKPLRAWHEQSCRKMGRVHDVRSGESRRGDTSIWVPIGLCDSDGTRSLQSSYRWHGPRRHHHGLQIGWHEADWPLDVCLSLWLYDFECSSEHSCSFFCDICSWCCGHRNIRLSLMVSY